VIKLLGIIGAATLTFGLISPAQAMGSGDAYENMQVGVTYTVYEPSFTAGLKARHIGGNDLCPKGTEENLSAQYGKGNTRNFTITEGNPMCSDIGVGEVVLKTTISGASAVVEVYCDPSLSKKCTKADVIKYGGHLEVTLPGVNGLRPTRIWIETFGGKNLSAQQLVQIAKSLTPVGS
jgi:hypothetical protein